MFVSEFDVFGEAWESAEVLQGRVRRILVSCWTEARTLLMNAGVISADTEMWLLKASHHMGDAQHRIDRWLHQTIADAISAEFRSAQVLGEESNLSNLLLDRRRFRLVAYADALDGSRQAFTLPGAWSINVVLQEFLGVDAATGMPRCRLVLLGVIDAEGVTATWSPGIPGVDLRLNLGEVTGEDDLQLVHADQLLISEGESFGVTGDLTVLAGGYKPSWWKDFRELRESLPRDVMFNTAGGPVARKVLQNDDSVVVQLQASTLWDGIAAGLIAAGGGFVYRAGEIEAIPEAHVLGWFDAFGYQRSAADDAESDELTEAYPIPAFVAGMNPDKVQTVAEAIARGSAMQRDSGADDAGANAGPS